MRYEGIAVRPVVRREFSATHDGCGSDHRVNAQGAFAPCGVEEAGGFEDLRVAAPFGFSSTNLDSLYQGFVKDTAPNFQHLRRTKHTITPSMTPKAMLRHS